MWLALGSMTVACGTSSAPLGGGSASDTAPPAEPGMVAPHGGVDPDRGEADDWPYWLGAGDSDEEAFMTAYLPDFRIHLDRVVTGKTVPCWAGSYGTLIRCLPEDQWTKRYTHAEATPTIELAARTSVEHSFTPGGDWETHGWSPQLRGRWSRDGVMIYEGAIGSRLETPSEPGAYTLLVACTWIYPDGGVGGGTGRGWIFDVSVT
jgi:hypothetical protein